MNETKGTVVVAPLGPNPAPLIELVWALAKREKQPLRVEAAFVPLTERGRMYFDAEVLATGAALDDLHRVLPDVLPREALHDRDVTLAGGMLVQDDDTAPSAAAYRAAIWRAAREAQQLARDRPVVFALGAGRRRTMTALTATVFQLLARVQDVCVDVRVDNPLAEGGTGFFFPEQSVQKLQSRGRDQAAFVARDVDILLIEVPLPRLRGLLREEQLASFESALAAGQAAVAAREPPHLRLDCLTATIFVEQERLPLRQSWFLWYLALAIARRRSDESWMSTDLDDPVLKNVARACKSLPWAHKVRSKALRQLMGEKGLKFKTEGKGNDLRVLRSEARKAIRDWCDELPERRNASFLEPENDRTGDGRRDRLRIPAELIEIVGLDLSAERLVAATSV